MDELFGNQVEDPADTRERRRVERAVFETDRQLIEGDLTLPPAGYQSRFSDSLNRGEFEFVPLTRVRITSLADSKVTEVAFLVLSKRQIRIAYPVEQ
jgi:hypothetical protein